MAAGFPALSISSRAVRISAVLAGSLLIVALSSEALAQAEKGFPGFEVIDTPGDDGLAISVSWEALPEERKVLAIEGKQEYQELQKRLAWAQEELAEIAAQKAKVEEIKEKLKAKEAAPEQERDDKAIANLNSDLRMEERRLSILEGGQESLEKERDEFEHKLGEFQERIAAAETPLAAWQYRLEIKGEGAEWQPVLQKDEEPLTTPWRTGFQLEAPQHFGFSPDLRFRHWVEIPILDTFPPPSSEEFDRLEAVLKELHQVVEMIPPYLHSNKALRKFFSSSLEARMEAKNMFVTALGALKPVEGLLSDTAVRMAELLKKAETEEDFDRFEEEFARLKQEDADLSDRWRELAARVAREKEELCGRKYQLRLSLVQDGQTLRMEQAAARAHPNWLSDRRLNNLWMSGLLIVFIMGYIFYSRKKKNLYLRRIPGLDALEEAVGRATEMGRPLYYLTGRLGFTENEKSISTVAATIVLEQVAYQTAQYECALKVPHTEPIVCGVCQDIIREAYMRAGRPDSFREENNFFITYDQFSYTAAVNGMFLRENPAAILYFGYYYAESLLLAETGAAIGAIQVAATDAEHQLPFFFVACDYTIIGEELYAASAYLSKDPVVVGTVKGQDLGKAFFVLYLLLALITALLGNEILLNLLKTF